MLIADRTKGLRTASYHEAMPEEPKLSLEDFGASFKGFMDQVAAQAPKEEPALFRRMREHLGQDPTILPVLEEKFPAADHPNVQVAVDALVGSEGCSASAAGITWGNEYEGVSLSTLVTAGVRSMFGGPPPQEGPLQLTNITLNDGRVLACVQRGLYFINKGEERLVLLVSGPTQMGWRNEVRVEAMACEKVRAERLLGELRSLMRSRNVYRGHVLSLSLDQMHSTRVNFHRLPEISRDGIILPKGLLERIERSTVRFAAHRDRLLKAGRHLKRGILLHGTPGTGKTLTAMYLASQMKDRTVILLTGQAMGLIEQSCAMARSLQPSMLVLEDVDLIGQERERQSSGCNALLFQLLNQMDGLADDADIIFMLTTNRADVLEPALASRPGRVDSAFEFPLPDPDGRRRLFELYGRGLALDLSGLDRFVARTEKASPAFIRELLRKAALFAAEDGETIVVNERHLDEAMHDLVVGGGELTMSLLGARGSGRESP